MKPVYNRAGETVSGMWVMGVMTAAFLGFFVGWAVWAYHPAHKDDMDRASLMPFDDGDAS